jgi:hypothetical protein
MKSLSPKIINETAQFWSKRTGRELSEEDARQIIENMTGFFRVLSEWEAAERSPRMHSKEVYVSATTEKRSR